MCATRTASHSSLRSVSENHWRAKLSEVCSCSLKNSREGNTELCGVQEFSCDVECTRIKQCEPPNLFEPSVRISIPTDLWKRGDRHKGLHARTSEVLKVVGSKLSWMCAHHHRLAANPFCILELFRWHLIESHARRISRWYKCVCVSVDIGRCKVLQEQEGFFSREHQRIPRKKAGHTLIGENFLPSVWHGLLADASQIRWSRY